MLISMPNQRKELAALVLELESNRAVLDGLTDWYEVFVFTGGRVPTAHWNLSAMTSYLEHPPTADGRWAAEIGHYRHSAQAIGDLGQAGTGPRTLRCRHDLGDRFGQAAAEMRLATDGLASSMMKAMERLRPFSPVAESMLSQDNHKTAAVLLPLPPGGVQ